MSSRSRSRETDVLIKVASGEPFKAGSSVLRTFSDSARGLPANSEEWDVSGLLLDGQPFSRDTVSCWLSSAHSAVDGLEELGPQDIQHLSTVTGLTQVLGFADAVGSCVSLLKAACSQLQQLKFVVQLPEQVLELSVTGRAYFWLDKQLSRYDLDKICTVGFLLDSDEQLRDVQQQVAQQLSALLLLGHMLWLHPLLDLLHQFTMLNARPDQNYLLSGVAGFVFTDAVLDAALGSSTLSKELYISSVMSQPFSLTPHAFGHSSLLQPVGPMSYDTSNSVLMFDAELMRDFDGGRAGETVEVELDLFGPDPAFHGNHAEIRLSGDNFVRQPVQLLLGHTFSDAAALEDLLGRPAA